MKYTKAVVAETAHNAPQVIFDRHDRPWIVSAVREQRTLPGRINSTPVWVVSVVPMEEGAE